MAKEEEEGRQCVGTLHREGNLTGVPVTPKGGCKFTDTVCPRSPALCVCAGPFVPLGSVRRRVVAATSTASPAPVGPRLPSASKPECITLWRQSQSPGCR